ncbi:MAG: glycine cleavage system aminomethyltransferase GcvT [Bacteroidetes bacterium]|nr:glycine cleavage system aminomethyltransferase GcvT [Bacteroidota bacterium]
MLKKTPFNDIHVAAGARMVEFGGWDMPVQYKNGIVYEHHIVRNKVGVFDVSHMGEVEVKGADAEAFLNLISTNDVSKLAPGKAQYTAMCYENGGIVDDMIIYKLPKYFMVVVNASNKDKDFDWMKKHVSGDVQLRDESDETALLAVQGPDAVKTLQKLTDTDLSKIPYYGFEIGKLAGVDMYLSRTGYTGEPGFELYFHTPHAASVWKAIFEAGAEFGIEPVGLGCRDTLRTEMGYALYGNDISQDRNPLEAGLGWITKLDKTNFIGRDALLKIKADGLKKRLTGIVLDEKAIPRSHYEVVNEAGDLIGEVTSGTFSPSMEKGIAMAYLQPEFSKEGTRVGIKIRNGVQWGSVVKFPFLKK